MRAPPKTPPASPDSAPVVPRIIPAGVSGISPGKGGSGDHPGGDYRVTVTVRNARLARAIEDAGYSSAAAFCRAAHVPPQNLSAFLTFRRPAMGVLGVSRSIEKISNFLGLPVEELVPPAMMDRVLARNSVTSDMDETEVASAMMVLHAPQKTPEEYLRLQESNAEILRVVATLPSRYALAIRLNMGLEDGRPWTLEEISRHPNISFAKPGGGLTRERVRQMILKGMRMLKHPARSSQLREYYKEGIET